MKKSDIRSIFAIVDYIFTSNWLSLSSLELRMNCIQM